MRIKAITIDLYGTLASDNYISLVDICKRINATSRVYEATAAKIGKSWFNLANEFYQICYGDKFLNHSDLETVIIKKLLEYYKSRLDADEIYEEIKAESLRPRLFDDARLFLTRLPLPCVVVSNGDRAVVESAIDYLGISVDDIVTSEDARAYKPNYRLFEYVADKLKMYPQQILHVGNSIAHDVNPAKDYGMKAVFLNRYGHTVKGEIKYDMMCENLHELRAIIK